MVLRSGLRRSAALGTRKTTLRGFELALWIRHSRIPPYSDCLPLEHDEKLGVRTDHGLDSIPISSSIERICVGVLVHTNRPALESGRVKVLGCLALDELDAVIDRLEWAIAKGIGKPRHTTTARSRVPSYVRCAA